MCKYLPKGPGTLKHGITCQLVNVTVQSGHGHCRSVGTAYHTLHMGTLWSHWHQNVFTAHNQTMLQLSCLQEALFLQEIWPFIFLWSYTHSRVPSWRLTLLKHSHLHSRHWCLLHTFLKMTPLMFPRAKGIHFGLPLLAFRVCSQVLPNRHEEFVLLQLKVKAQNTSAVQTENWEKNLQEVIKHLWFYIMTNHLLYVAILFFPLTLCSNQCPSIYNLDSVKPWRRFWILWMRVARVASCHGRNKILHLQHFPVWG